MTVAYEKVSVLVPFRNDAKTIVAAIDSICEQTWPNLELLLCHDHSTDGAEILAAERLREEVRVAWRLFDVEGRGAAAARNAGLQAMTGDWVAFLDADDTWAANKIERCLVEASRAGANLVGHAEEWRAEDGSKAHTVRYRHLIDHGIPLALSVFRQNPFSTSAVMMRRELAIAAGLFDETLPSAEDFDYWLRVCLVPGVRLEMLDDVLGTYTLRSGSESSRVDARHKAMLTIGERFADAINGLSGATPLEGWRYRSRVRLATGVRLFGTGQRARGIGLALAGLLQWPFRADLVRYFLARRQSI